jgi:hypothetical protein
LLLPTAKVLYFLKGGGVWGNAPRFYFRSRAFLEVWNQRTDKLVGKPKGLLLPKAKVLSFCDRKRFQELQTDFHVINVLYSGVIIIKYYRNLIVDKHCAEIVEEIFNSIENNTAVYNVYAVCVTPNKNTLFEILSIGNLIEENSRFKTDFGIIALVRGKKAAVRTVENMFKVWLNFKGSLDGIKDYYLKNCD